MTDPGPTMSRAQGLLRFALELIAWGSAAWWGASLFEGTFADGFHHVDDWVPQRLVTATGPNPLPR